MLSLEGRMKTSDPGNSPAPALGGLDGRPCRIGRYELVDVLGKGGMASVYVGRLAGPAGFEKLVAVKIIHPHLLDEREFVSMFLDEARIAACIQHPNVAAITEMGEDDGLLYMVGELVQGESLRAVMRRAREERALLPPGISAYLVAKVCDGLHAAHELTDGAGRPCHIVHRDVSPQNVLVSYGGHVKLIDFGVAQARDRITHTQTGTIKGKIGYLSPEQLRGQPLDRRSDVFSAGVVLYQLLTGTHPFPGESDLQRLDRIARAEFTPPRELEPSVPPALERVAVRALARDPADRFPTAAAMAQALGEANRETGERIGATRLAAMMKWLFSREMADRAKRLEDGRERSAGGTPAAPGGLVDSRTRERWTATGSGRPALASRGSRILRGIAFASAALLLSAAAATLALVLAPREAPGPPAVAPVAAAAVERPEAAPEMPPAVVVPEPDLAPEAEAEAEADAGPAPLAAQKAKGARGKARRRAPVAPGWAANPF
jgi:serine/threonine-protein kinase